MISVAAPLDYVDDDFGDRRLVFLAHQVRRVVEIPYVKFSHALSLCLGCERSSVAKWMSRAARVRPKGSARLGTSEMSNLSANRSSGACVGPRKSSTNAPRRASPPRRIGKNLNLVWRCRGIPAWKRLGHRHYPK